MEEFVTVLFENREENSAFDIEDKELMAWQAKLENNEKELHKIISDNLPEEIQPRYDHIMLEMQEIQRNILDIKKKSCYRVGLKDGANIKTTLEQ